MFQLLQPIWLFAMAGIVIPIIIHLWDVKGGKTLQVGSILLIQESAKLQGRSLRLTDLFLLILRCLLIILLAVLLAKPSFKHQLSSSGEKGWMMIEKQSVGQAYENYKPTIDSLIESGYKFHYFNKGFAEDDLADVLKSDNTIESEPEIAYWTLLKQLNEQIPPEMPVYLFTDNQLHRFEGVRPALSMSLRWSTYQLKDTMLKSAVSVHITPGDSLRIFTANISNTSIQYNSENITGMGNSSFRFVNDKIFVSGEGNKELNIDTSALELIIFTDDYITDANYLKAAIEAIAGFTQYKMNVVIVKDASQIRANVDWLFWLSEKPVTTPETAGNVFLYAKGKVHTGNSWIRVSNKKAINQEPISISRRIEAGASAADAQIIWEDGFGNTLLDLSQAQNNVYQFYSRFNPAWTELPWSAQFADMLFDLIMREKFTPNDVDKRIIDVGLIQPVKAKEKNNFAKEKFVKTTDLSKYFWLMVFVIFAIERFFSFRNKQVYV